VAGYFHVVPSARFSSRCSHFIDYTPTQRICKKVFETERGLSARAKIRDVAPRRQHSLGIILIAILILLFILVRSFRLIHWRPY